MNAGANGQLSFANRAHGLRARFADDGSVELSSRGGAAGPLVVGAGSWTGSLRTVAWGRGDSRRPFGGGAARRGDCDGSGRTDAEGGCLHRAEIEGSGASEWWINDGRGLEQGWTLRDRPAGEGFVVLEVAVAGLDVEVAGDGADAVLSAGADRLRYGSLLVQDSRGVVLRAWLEPADAGLALAFDDDGAEWPVTVDPIVSTTPWTGLGGQTSASFGTSVSSAGDVNGDGFGDVVVGAPNYTAYSNTEGGAFVFLGSATGLEDSASWIADGGQAYSYFGASVASAGDVDGDGFGDVVVGAFGWNGAESDQGRAHVYLGSASGLGATPSWSTTSDQAGADHGLSVSSAGDVNGDGHSDVAVGAPYWDGALPDCGGAFVYLGSASGVAPVASWTAESDDAGAYFGYSVAGAGDVDGDGYSDLIVGARSYDGGQQDEGRAYVFLGSSSGLGPAASWVAESDQAHARMGSSVAAAGDIDGDG